MFDVREGQSYFRDVFQIRIIPFAVAVESLLTRDVSRTHRCVNQVVPSRYRATLMCRMFTGELKRLSQAGHNLLTAWPRLDSVSEELKGSVGR